MDKLVTASLSNLQEDPEAPKITRGDALVPNFPIVPSSANPYFKPAIHFHHLVGTTSTNPAKIGKLLATNVAVTSRGAAMSRWTHDESTQRHMVLAMANVREHGTEAISVLNNKSDAERSHRSSLPRSGESYVRCLDWNSICDGARTKGPPSPQGSLRFKHLHPRSRQQSQSKP